LAKVLEYKDYRNFLVAVNKSMEACKNSGQVIGDHFGETTNMIKIGKGGKREVEDHHLSRYACYLVVQNADPTKEIVALGQTYFAIQTRRLDYAIFQNHGYMGLYGGMGAQHRPKKNSVAMRFKENKKQTKRISM